MSTRTKAKPKAAPKPKRRRSKVERPREPGAPLTVDEAAAELHVAPRTVRKLIATRQLAAFRVGKLWRVAERDLAEFKARPAAPAAPPAKSGTLTVRTHLKAAPKKGRGA